MYVIQIFYDLSKNISFKHFTDTFTYYDYIKKSFNYSKILP